MKFKKGDKEKIMPKEKVDTKYLACDECGKICIVDNNVVSHLCEPCYYTYPPDIADMYEHKINP